MKKLTRSIRIYRKLVMAIPYSTHMTVSPEFREAVRYYRELVREFGKDRVREAMGR